jgi:hypothetical protein
VTFVSTTIVAAGVIGIGKGYLRGRIGSSPLTASTCCSPERL